LRISCFRVSRISAFGLRPVSKVNFCALQNPWQWSRLDAERPRVLRCYAAKETTRERSTKRHRSLPELCGLTFQAQRSERFGARSRGNRAGRPKANRDLRDLIQRMSRGEPTVGYATRPRRNVHIGFFGDPVDHAMARTALADLEDFSARCLVSSQAGGYPCNEFWQCCCTAKNVYLSFQQTNRIADYFADQISQ